MLLFLEMLDEECNASDVGASELFYGKPFPIFVVVESSDILNSERAHYHLA